MTMPAWTLTDKVIVITGGAGGIGTAVALELQRRGAIPVLADLDPAALETAAAEFATKPLTVEVDVTDRASCDAMTASVLDACGRIDAVWANAGIAAFGPVESIEPDRWRKVVDVNLLGAYETVRATLPAIVATRGYVALTCSVASFAHQPGVSAYAASKAGLEALGNALRIEVAHEGVAVGTIHPGYVETNLVTSQEGTDPAYRRMRAALRPPFNTVVPVERVVPEIADGFARRAQRVVTPRSGWLVHALRPVLNTRPFTRSLRAAAPEIQALSRKQAKG